jgi:membrane protease YdiL (CAAX protease family)
MKASFFNWPENGNVGLWTVFLTLLLVAVAFIGFGQIPLLMALNDAAGLSAAGMGMAEMADLLGKNFLLTLILIPFILCFIAVLFGVKFIHRMKVADFFSAGRKFDIKRVLFSAGLSLLILSASLLIDYFTSGEIKANYHSDTFWSLLLIGIFIIPIQTTCEELLFRSYLFKGFSVFGKPIISILITGFAFGMMHAGNPEIDVLGKEVLIFYIWSGFFLGVMTYLDNGLELAIGYHAINNIFAAVVITNNWQAFQTDALLMDYSEPSLGWALWGMLFLLQPMILFIFGKKYKWNYSDLLLGFRGR